MVLLYIGTRPIFLYGEYTTVILRYPHLSAFCHGYFWKNTEVFSYTSTYNIHIDTEVRMVRQRLTVLCVGLCILAGLPLVAQENDAGNDGD